MRKIAMTKTIGFGVIVIGVAWALASAEGQTTKPAKQPSTSPATQSSTLAAFVEKPFGFGFRGNGQGRFPDAKPVTEWSQTKNVVWATTMPAPSNASPALCGDRLFVCSDPSTVICVNLADGKILWQKSTLYSELTENPSDPSKDKDLPKTHNTNGYSSATPVTDGKHVWAVFGTGVVVCFDKDGNRVWAKKLENPPHEWGSSISPVLAGDTLLVQYDHMFGLDAATGKEKWKVSTTWRWGTPVVGSFGDDLVAVTGMGNAIHVKDGSAAGQVIAVDNYDSYNSLLLQDGVLYYVRSNPKAFRQPAPGGPPEKVWDGEKLAKGRYYATPLLHEGLLYAINESHTLSVIDAKTGKKVYDKTLDHLNGTAYSSPTLGGKYVFVSGEGGNTVVLEAGREYKEVARNTLEPFRTSPVFADGRMYVRTLKTLYCIGK
jgi:outer membrane protein assembly factor BamB